MIPRNDLDFSFGPTQFHPKADRDFLGWVFDQFLYGEVTGIQCGYWLYRAPTLAAASFLARQAAEELSHVKRIIRIQTLLGVLPNKPHRAVKFLSTGMMGGSWGEHVCMEMALGEGLVLTIFYALAATIDNPEIQKIIESAIVDEEKHVEFGEKETLNWLKRYPEDRSTLLAEAVLQAIAMRWLKNFALKKIPAGHPVLKKFPEFYDHTVSQFESRVFKLGLTDVPLREIGTFSRLKLLLLLPLRRMKMRFRRSTRKLLTETYLSDGWLVAPEAKNPAPPMDSAL